MPRGKSKSHHQGDADAPDSIHILSRWSNSFDRWLAHFTQFIPFWMPDDSYYYFLCYDSAHGEIKIFKPGYEDEIFGAWPQPVKGSGLPSDSKILPFVGRPYLLCQQRSTAKISFVEIAKDANSGEFSMKQDDLTGLPSSLQIMPMASGTDLFVAAYDGDNLMSYKIDRAGHKADRVSAVAWGKGWTDFAPLTDNYFVSLNATKHELGAGKLNANGTLEGPGAPFLSLRGRNAVTGLVGTDGPTFLVYTKNGGNAPDIYTLSWKQGSAPTYTEKPSADWPGNISSIAVFTLSREADIDNLYYLVYQHSIPMAAAFVGSSSSLSINSGMKPTYPMP